MLVGQQVYLDGYAASVVHVREAHGDRLLVVMVDAKSGGRASVGCIGDEGPQMMESLAAVSLGVQVHVSGTLVEATGTAKRFVPYALRSCTLR